MNKIFAFLFLGILLLGTVSAADFDNVKTYINNDRSVVIKNAMGFGKDLGKADLVTPNINYVQPGKDRRVMIFTINTYDEMYRNGLGEFDILNMKTGKYVEKEFKFEYAIYGEVTKDITEQVCVDKFSKIYGNTKHCEQKVIGKKVVEEIIEWRKLDTNDLPKGRLTVGVITDVKVGDHYDGIPTIMGEKLTRWAEWTDSFNIGLQTYYKLDDATSGTDYINNSISSTSNQLKVFDAPDSVPGRINEARSFDGSNDYLRNATMPFNIGNEYSYSFWMNVSEKRADSPILDSTTLGTKDNSAIYTGASELRAYFYNGVTYVSFDSAEDYSLNLWYHVLVTYNGTDAIMYVDGNYSNMLNIAAQFNETAPLSLGKHTVDSNPNNFYSGDLDEVAIWNRSLSASEVSDLYNSGNGISYFSPITEVTLNSPEDNFNTNNQEITFNCTSTETEGGNIQNVSLWANQTGTWEILDESTGLSSSTVESIFTYDFGDDFEFDWTCQACNDGGDCNYAIENKTATIDTVPPIIIISYPNLSLNYGFDNKNTSLNLSIIESSADTCLYEYHGVNTSLNCANPNTTFLDTAGEKKIIVWVNDTFGNSGINTTTWQYNIFENSRTFSASSTEGASKLFKVNLTTAGQQVLSSYIVYNNTLYGANPSSDGTNYILSTTLVIPDVTSTTVNTFYWNVSLDDGNWIKTNEDNQTIYNLSLDDCSSYSTVLFNLSLKDEVSQVLLNQTNQNTTIEVDLDITPWGSTTPILSFSNNYTKINPAVVCISQDLTNVSYRLDSTIRYEADSYEPEYYNFQKFNLSESSIPQELDLFDLLTSRSTPFLITYKSAVFLPVEGALLDITRNYVSQGIFKTVELPKTDFNGQTVAHLEKDNVVYNIIVKKEGEILSTFNNIVPVCANSLTQECNIGLNELVTDVPFENWEEESGVSINWKLNTTSRVLTAEFTTLDGTTTTANLVVTKFDSFGNHTACDESLTTSSGTITCNIDESFSNSTIIAEFYNGNRIVQTRYFSLLTDTFQTFGYTGIFLTFLIVLSFSLMMITEKVGVIIGAVFGLIFSSILGIYSGGAILGSGSTILWAIVA